MPKSSQATEKTFTEKQLISSLQIDGPQLTSRGYHYLHDGDGEASYIIGLWYLAYKGRHNYPKALAWFRRGDAQNHSGAQTQIGCMYLEGNGVSKDEKLGLEWLMKAVENDRNRHTCAILGQVYEFGIGVPKDAHAAIEWYSRAAMKGHPCAQWRLGCMYEEVEEIKNISTGGFWKRRAPAHQNMFIHDHLQRFYSVIFDPDMDHNMDEIEYFNLVDDLSYKDSLPMDCNRVGPLKPRQKTKEESNLKGQEKEPDSISVADFELLDHQFKTLKKTYQEHLESQQKEKAEHKKEMEALKEETAVIEARLREKDEEVNQLKEDLIRYKSKLRNKAR